MDFHSKTVKETAKILGTSLTKGLEPTEVVNRLNEYGKNKLSQAFRHRFSEFFQFHFSRPDKLTTEYYRNILSQKVHLLKQGFDYSHLKSERGNTF